MRSILFCVLLVACDKRVVNISAPNGTSVTAQTELELRPGTACVQVTITSASPMLVPVFIPIPVPYQALAEKQP